MKKRIAMALIALASALSLTACRSSRIVENVKEETVAGAMFERHNIDGYYSILVDKDTKVCYLEYDGVHQYGITVMLNPDGTPKIWEE